METFKTKILAENHLMSVCKKRNAGFNGFVFANTGSEKIELPEGYFNGLGVEMLFYSTNVKGNRVVRKETEYVAFKNH